MRSSLSAAIAAIQKHLSCKPRLHHSSFIARGATVLGNVQLGEDSSVWYNSVLRGDINSITIGCRSNVQDGAVIHVTRNFPVVLGDDVSIAHNVTLHGCTVGNKCLIGMGAVVLDDAFIGDNSIVGAGAVVTEGKRFPPNSLILGSPARRIRDLTSEDAEMIATNAARYCEYARVHRNLGRQDPNRWI